MAKPDLTDHKKFRRLRRLLDNIPTPYAVGLLELMWLRGYQTGDPNLGDVADVEGAAEWPGELGRFCSACVESGFLVAQPDGSFVIHDLLDHAPEWARKRMLRKRQGLKRVGRTADNVRHVSDERRTNGAECPTRGGEFDQNTAARLAETRDKIQETKPPLPPKDRGTGGGWVATLETPTPDYDPYALPPPPPADFASQTFPAFWDLFPRKERELDCQREWRAIISNTKEPQALVHEIMESVRRWLPLWLARDPDKMPTPFDWLSKKRWPEIPPMKPQQTETRYRKAGQRMRDE